VGREILFKAKCVETGKWVEGFYYKSPFERHGTTSRIIELYGNENQKRYVDPKTVCQYIGIDDNDGNKIFEGDKIKYNDSYGQEFSFGEIEYQNETGYPAFEIEPRIDCDSNGISYIMVEGCIKITGNIHDDGEV